MERRSLYALLCALAGTLALACLWLLAFHSGRAHALDADVLNGFLGLDRPRTRPLADFIAHLADPKPFVAIGAAIALAAVLRGRARVAAAIAIVLLGANVTTQLLKQALAEPRIAEILGIHQVGPVAWPSGHSTASMSLALCAVLAAPARARPLVAAIGAVFTVGVVFSLLTLGWHYPSDVLGGFLVAATWTSLAVAAVWAADARWPPRRHATSAEMPLAEALLPVAAVALAAIVLGLLVALARPHTVIDYARAHTAFVAGAGALGALVLALAAGLTLVLRGPPADAGAAERARRRG